MVAEMLGVPQATELMSVEIGAGGVAGRRATDAGTMEVSAPLPAVISIMVAIAEKPPREAGIKIVNEGDAGEKLAEFLVQNRLV
jgi:electron transfer flavoprotein beta subunit